MDFKSMHVFVCTRARDKNEIILSSKNGWDREWKEKKYPVNLRYAHANE